MHLGVYLNAAGALAAEARLDVIANNLANVDTPGFRRGHAVFQERLEEAMEPPRYEPSARPILDRLGGGLLVHEVTYDARQGGLESTGEPLDLALRGDGWFAVRTDAGARYTRAGNFLRQSDGLLVTADGRAQVLDDEGEPIQLPPGRLSVDARGEIRVDDRPIARLAVVGTVDHRQYIPDGSNLYRHVGDETPGPAEGIRVEQGFLERSTVSPVREMVALIRTFRSYEANQSMIQQQDAAFGRVVNDVGRVGG